MTTEQEQNQIAKDRAENPERILNDKLSEEEVRKIAYSSIGENEERGLEAQRVIAHYTGHELTEVKGEIHFFEKVAEKEGISVAEINGKIAKANAVFAECNRINKLKARSQGWEQAANAGIVGVEDQWQAEMQGLAPVRGLVQMLEQDHGMPKLDDFVELRHFKSETGNIGQIIAAANAMTRDGGTGNDPTGITPNRPQQVTSPYQVVDRRRSVLERLPRFPVSNDTFKYLKEVETQSSSTDTFAAVAENAQYPYQTIGAIEQSVTVRKVAAFTSISKEQLADVPHARSYSGMILSRIAMDTSEKKVLQDDGSGENIVGFFNADGKLTNARAAASGSPAQPDGGRTLINFLADSFAKYGKPRAASGGGAGTSPSHLVLSNEDYWKLCKSAGSDGHYLWGSPVSGGQNEIWGVDIIQNDFLPADSALLFNNDPRYVLMITREGYEFQSGQNGEDFRNGRVSFSLTTRFAMAYPRPVTIMALTNMDGS